MLCSRCGHENPDDARFCGECGEPQQVEERREPGLYRPLDSAPPGGAVPAASPTEPTDIPPRDLGQLIGETFRIYGKAILPLFVIALVSQIPNMLGIALSPGGEPISADREFDYTTGLILPLLGFLISIPSTAAAVFCVGQALTGRNVDVITCYSRALSVLVPSAVVIIIVTLALIGSGVLMLIVIGIPLFFYLLVVWFFAVQAVVIEGRDGISALGRSRELTRGSWWRLFGIGVVFTLIFFAVLFPGVIVSGIISVIRIELLAIGIGAATAVAIPLLYIGSVLVYVDLRVRKEGYSLQALADDLRRRPEQAR